MLEDSLLYGNNGLFSFLTHESAFLTRESAMCLF